MNLINEQIDVKGDSHLLDGEHQSEDDNVL
jgi:hypothetical protein